MISSHFRISNPWAKDDFDNKWNKSWLPFKNKGLELEFIRYSPTIAEFQFDLSFRRDHAGLKLELGLFSYSIHFSFYDTRHWDSENDQWQVYDAAYFEKVKRDEAEWQEIIEAKKAARKAKKNETATKEV
jgi:hypothetical protein